MTVPDISRPSRGVPRCPASYAQRAMWALAQRYRGAPLNVMILPWRIHGALDAAALADALSALVARHSALRTRLVYEGGELWQAIEAPTPVSVHFTTAEGATLQSRMSKAHALLREEGSQPLTLTSASPLRVRLIKLDAAEHVLCLFIHHAFCDGMSSQVIMADLMQLYATRITDGAARIDFDAEQYSDFTLHQRNTWESGGYSQSINYWRNELADAPAPLDLSNGVSRKGNRDFRARSPIRKEPSVVLDGLKSFAQSRKVSLFSVLLAGLGVLLHRRAGAEDFLVGVSTANRWSVADMRLVGCATNLLPARLHVPSSANFDALVTQVHATTKRLLVYGRVPLELILREIQGPLMLGNALPIWCQFREVAPALVFPTEGLTVVPFSIERAAILCDLEVDLRESDSVLEVEFAHRATLFNTETIRTMMDEFGVVLHEIASGGTLSARH